MTRIAIVLGSTRPNRVGESAAHWVLENAPTHTDVPCGLIDLAEQNPPLHDDPCPPAMNECSPDHTKAWSEKLSSSDSFIFVTPECNHSVPSRRGD